MTKNKNISVNPAKGISIIIKNEFPSQLPIKPKKKRKYKRKTNLDLLKMPTMPSYIPAGDVSYIKPQYAATSLNRNMIFPGVPQSLPPPPIYPQLTAPPVLPQIQAPPVNFNLDGSFSKMLENMMMPREYGYKSQSYVADNIDEDIMDSLPPEQQDKYIEQKIAPQIEEQLKDIKFENDDEKIKVRKEVINIKASKALGTRHANKLTAYDERYNDNDYYKQNYISRLQEILNEDSIKTRAGLKQISIKNKEKAKELLKAIGGIKEEKPIVEKPKEKLEPTNKEKIFFNDFKEYKEYYISKNKKYKSYSKEGKEAFVKDLKDIFENVFYSSDIINKSLQDKKQKDEVMKKVKEQITQLKNNKIKNEEEIKKLDVQNESYFKDIEDRVKIAEAWVEHIKNKQDEVINPQKESVKQDLIKQRELDKKKKEEEEDKIIQASIDAANKKEEEKIKRAEARKAKKKEEEDKKVVEPKPKKKK